MNDKTIKELAIELTVETTNICDEVKGRSVFVNQLLRQRQKANNSLLAEQADSDINSLCKFAICHMGAIYPYGCDISPSGM